MRFQFFKKSVAIFNKSCIYLLIVFMSSSSVKIYGGPNLPQIAKKLKIQKDTHSLLQDYFNKFEGKPNAVLDEKIENELLDYLKDDYYFACIEMISRWGTIADGTAQLRLKVLFNGKQLSQRLVLFGLRCYSNYSGYGEKYCDERLVLLLIHPQETEMILLPHAENCTNCAELSQIQFDHIIQNDNFLFFSLLISISNENPCCDGPYQYREEKINYYALLQTGVKQVASIIRYRNEYFHDDVDGDTNTIYSSTIRNEVDQNNNFLQIISEYKLQENDIEKESGIKYYKWNPSKEIFESENQ